MTFSPASSPACWRLTRLLASGTCMSLRATHCSSAPPSPFYSSARWPCSAARRRMKSGPSCPRPRPTAPRRVRWASLVPRTSLSRLSATQARDKLANAQHIKEHVTKSNNKIERISFGKIIFGNSPRRFFRVGARLPDFALCLISKGWYTETMQKHISSYNINTTHTHNIYTHCTQEFQPNLSACSWNTGISG